MRKMDVTNDAGRTFTAVLRQPGDLLISGLTNEHTRKDDYKLGPQVEIFDATYAADKRFGREGLGQFVCSYLLDTLIGSGPTGLDMGGPEWRLTARNVTLILASLTNVALIGRNG